MLKKPKKPMVFRFLIKKTVKKTEPKKRFKKTDQPWCMRVCMCVLSVYLCYRSHSICTRCVYIVTDLLITKINLKKIDVSNSEIPILLNL